jgi:hypothetical protein
MVLKSRPIIHMSNYRIIGISRGVLVVECHLTMYGFVTAHENRP